MLPLGGRKASRLQILEGWRAGATVQAKAGALSLADREPPGTVARSGSYQNVTLPVTWRGLVRHWEASRQGLEGR